MFDLSLSGGCIVNKRFSACADPRFLAVLDVVRGADLSFIHLEGTICEPDDPEVFPAAEAGWTWRRMPRSFGDELRWAGYHVVSHASNHALDYMYGGLYSTWATLRDAGIPFAGTGMTLAEARQAAVVESPNKRLALISASTSTADWARAADPVRNDRGRPGVNQIRQIYAMDTDLLADTKAMAARMGWWVTEVGDGFMLNPSGLHNTITRFTLGQGPGARVVADRGDVEANLEAIRAAKRDAEFVMFHVHDHEFDIADGLSAPPEFIRELAHATIDAGADLFIAEGAHSLLRGIEIYKGKPVFYDPGDLFKDGNSKIRPPEIYYWKRGTNPETGREEIITADSRWHTDHKKLPVASNPPGGYNTGKVLAVIVPLCRFDDDGRLVEIRIHPAKHMQGDDVHGLPGIVTGAEAEEVIAYLAELSAPFGTTIAFENGVGSHPAMRQRRGASAFDDVFETDVVVVGFGGAGGCAAIEAHDCGAEVIVVEKQPEGSHYPNTRMSGGGYHSPSRDGEFEALKAYAKAMFSGDNLPHMLEGEQPDFADELSEAWATHAPDNERFMRSLDPLYQTVIISGAAFPDFPGAARSGYAVVKSTYTGAEDEATWTQFTKDAAKTSKQSGEAFYACLLTGLGSRDIPIHFSTRGRELLVNADGEVTGIACERDGRRIAYRARRGVVLTCGGYEYNKRMRKAFLDGPGAEGWAFYGSTENTGDGIEMAMGIGAALTKVGKIAGRIICAIPERRHGLKIGLNTNGVGKPNEIVVDSYGNRYASERRITKDPSRYIFYREALQFDTIRLAYPRIPSWMIFDQTLLDAGPIVRVAAATYNAVDWGKDNRNALRKGWILEGATVAELAARIAAHPDNRNLMQAETLTQSVARFNRFCAEGHDADFEREPGTLGPVENAPFYAIPLYPGGPNTKGGLRANARREVLDWDDQPIPRLYTAGEISSAFQFVYQGGGNLAECITFGRLAGREVAAQLPLDGPDRPAADTPPAVETGTLIER